MNQTHKKSELRALVIYFSATGNTKKVANTISDALQEQNVKVTLLEVGDASKEELYDYDLVFLGSPSFQCLPAKPVMNYIDEKMKLHRERGDIKLCAPKLPGKMAVVFCTYSGPHTGLNEGITAGKYMGQLFEHIGFEVAAEWYLVGEFHGNEKFSTLGRLGDIRGRPNEQDLNEVKQKLDNLLTSILAM